MYCGEDAKGHAGMEERKEYHGSMEPETAASVRASISFSPDIYETLKRLARKKKVSLAWVVRDAVDRYVAEHDGRLERE